MKTSITKRIFYVVCACTLMSTLSVAQDRTVPEAPQQSDPEQKQKDWDSPDIVHPAPFGANSRDLNNIDPTIVPFEGEMPGPLGSQSREIGTPPGGTGPTIYNPEKVLGGDSRASGARAVGTIYQMPDGQLRFMLRPGICGTPVPVSRDDPDAPKGTELVDPPVMTSGSYNKPLGYGSRSEDVPSEANATLSSAELEQEPASKFGHVLEMSDGRVYVLEESQNDKENVPDALSAGSRAGGASRQQDIGNRVNHAYNAIGDKVVFVAAEWRGSFIIGNALDTFNRALWERKNKRYSSAEMRHAASGDASRNQHRTLAPDRHAVIGWANISRGTKYWIAIKQTSPSSIRYMRHDGVGGDTTGFKVIDTSTNGQRIQIIFADNDRGGFAWRFRLVN